MTPNDNLPPSLAELLEPVAKALRDTSYPKGHILANMAWPGGKEYWLGLSRAALAAIAPALEQVRVEKDAEIYRLREFIKDLTSRGHAALAKGHGHG